MQVLFNNVDEFVEEITKDRKRISRSILRLTCQSRKQGQSLLLSVIASAVIGGIIVRLNCPVGDCHLFDRASFTVLSDKSAEIISCIRVQARKLRLDVRDGLFE